MSAGFAPQVVPRPDARCSPVTPLLMCGSSEQHLLPLKGALLGLYVRLDAEGVDSFWVCALSLVVELSLSPPPAPAWQTRRERGHDGTPYRRVAIHVRRKTAGMVGEHNEETAHGFWSGHA